MTLGNILLVASLLPVLMPAGAARATEAEKPQVAVEAVGLREDDDRFVVLWRLAPPTGWHLYADLRNDAGYPPSLRLELPEGWTAGSLRWPPAERDVEAGVILDHVYRGELAVLQEIVAPPGAVRDGPVTVTGKWDWLACREMCVPGETPVAVRFAAAPPSGPDRAALAAARAALPSPAPPGGLRAVWSEGAVELAVPGAAALEFHPTADCARLVDAIADGASAGDRLKLRLRPGADGYGPVRGILRQAMPDGSQRDWTVDLPYGG